VNSIADSKPKYRNIVISENMYFFFRTVSDRKLEFLGDLVSSSYEAFEVSSDAYVVSSVEYHFKGFREFVDEVEVLLERTTYEDLKFVKPREDMRRIVAKVSKPNIEAAIGQFQDRLIKHFKSDSLLRPLIATKFFKYFCSKYKSLEKIAYKCYGEILHPSHGEVLSWLNGQDPVNESF